MRRALFNKGVFKMMRRRIDRKLTLLGILMMFAFINSVQAQLIPPSNLTAAAGDRVVDLQWGPPDFGFWLHWDNGNIFTGVGTGTPIEFKSAIRFPADSLMAFDVGGRRLTEVRFVPQFANCTYSINVWVGGEPTNPDELVVNQLVQNPVTSAWNTVVLNNPVRIDPTQELWIGVNYNTQGGHPAGCDNGPATDGFGNMIFINNNWQTLTQANPELNYNWNIQGFVGPREGRGDSWLLSNEGLSAVTDEPFDDGNRAVTLHSDNESIPMFTLNPDTSFDDIIYAADRERREDNEERDSLSDEHRNDVLGYNVYRNGIIANDELLTDYYFRDRDVINYQEYTYTATALYRSGESRMSNPVEVTPKLPRPFDLTAIAGESIVRLRWDSYDHPDLLGFNLYRNNQLVNDEPLLNTRYNDTEVNNGVLYVYHVTSVYSERESEPSNVVQATPDVLERPRNLQAVVGDGIVFLRWEAPEDEDVLGYKIYRNWSILREQTSLTYFDTDVINGQNYSYYVSALYFVGESSPTEPVEVTPEAHIISPTPRSLTAEISGNNNIYLEWEEPLMGEKIHWDSGNNANTFGTGSAAQFKSAIRFTQFDLLEKGVGGKYLTKVMFYPTYFNASYSINVWRGGNSSAPEELVIEQPLAEFTLDRWNIVDLNQPLLIDVSKELWIGLSIVTPAGRPMGADEGPAESGFGNMIFYNNAWAPLTYLNPAFNYNWNIQGFVSFEDDTHSITLSNRNREEERDNLQINSKQRLEVLGYNLYRNQSKVNTQPLTGTNFLDEGLTTGLYYEYFVTAVYENRESQPSNWVILQLLGNIPDYPNITMLYDNYPNPFNPETTIGFSLAEEQRVQITIYNIVGHKITTLADEVRDGGRHNIIWNGKDYSGKDVASGVYFYKMTTDSDEFVKKMIMIK